jgi:dihydrofolate reductase
MSKLTYLMNVSLDGFIEAPDHSLDWTVIDEEIHSWFNDRMRETAVSIYGRRMYDTMTAYWPTAASDPNITPVELEFARLWNATPKVVFSRSLDTAGYGFRLLRGDIGEELAQLRAEFDGEIDVSGANIASQFIERGLVDEFCFVIHPVILGAGTPVLPTLASRIMLRKTDERRFASGATALRYERA